MTIEREPVELERCGCRLVGGLPLPCAHHRRLGDAAFKLWLDRRDLPRVRRRELRSLPHARGTRL